MSKQENSVIDPIEKFFASYSSTSDDLGGSNRSSSSVRFILSVVLSKILALRLVRVRKALFRTISPFVSKWQRGMVDTLFVGGLKKIMVSEMF